MIAVDALGSVANIVAPVDLSGATQAGLVASGEVKGNADGLRAGGASGRPSLGRPIWSGPTDGFYRCTRMR